MRLLFALALACTADPADERDASAIDAKPDAAMDASEIDAGASDAEPADADPIDADPTDTGVIADQLPPTNAGELRPWLEAGSYTTWAAESGPHDSAGPHFGTVRTFINAALDQSLAAGNSEHPMGSAAVKELYGGGNTIRGYSVMVKTESGTGGDRWWWYERYNATTYAASQGDGQCVPCHSAGNDFFLSPYPLQ
jgi:hypothetical protein